MDGFRTTESSLYEYVSSFPEPAHLKDPKTARYIFSNQHNLKIYGLQKSREIVGLTVHDLDRFMKPYWGSAFVDKIDELDQVVLKERITIKDSNRVFLDKFGLVHIQDMSKVPILSKTNAVIAILTTSFDVTHKLSRNNILRIYQKIYSKNRDINCFFMKHIMIADFFDEVLSSREISCLLHMVENNSHKHISSKMNISPRTVESHLGSISNKLNNKSIFDVVEFLRITNNERKL